MKSIFNIEFSSKTLLIGWVLNDFIPKLTISNDEGLTHVDIKDYCINPRDDVYHIYNKEASGFNISLFDIFNDKPSNTSIYIDGHLVWSYNDYISGVDVSSNYFMNSKFERGSNRVFVIYENGDFLHEKVSQIDAWDGNYFAKNKQASIAYTFCSIDDYVKNKKSISDNYAIYFASRSIIKRLIIENPSVTDDLIIPCLRTSMGKFDFHGGFHVLSNLANLNVNDDLSGSYLFKILVSISEYPSIFFSKLDKNYFVYLCSNGDFKNPNRNMIDYIYNNVDDAVVCISDDDIITYDDLINKSCLFLFNMNYVDRLYDITDESCVNIVKCLYKRGLKVRRLKYDSFNF